jgi:hypothetical protein
MKKHADLSLNKKYLSYLTDGKGRDIYISSNSGGFSKQYTHGIELKENFPIKAKFKQPNIPKQAVPLVYRSDGSGRDSYILSMAGSLRKEVKGLKAYSLKDFLR